MKLIKQLLLAFLLFMFAPCYGQTRAIHFSIDGLSVGQKISLDELRQYVKVSGNDIQGWHYYQDYVLDDIYHSKTARALFHLSNGIISGIEIHLKSATGQNHNDYCKYLYELIMAEYGIYDKSRCAIGETYDFLPSGGYSDPNLSLQGKADYYCWCGSNGVELVLRKAYESCILEYTVTNTNAFQSSRAASLLKKLNPSTL